MNESYLLLRNVAWARYRATLTPTETAAAAVGAAEYDCQIADLLTILDATDRAVTHDLPAPTIECMGVLEYDEMMQATCNARLNISYGHEATAGEWARRACSLAIRAYARQRAEVETT